MVDAWLIITVILFSIILLAVMIVMVIVFGHPDDKNEAKFPKAVVILGLWLAFASVLVLPYDVANSRGSGGGLHVEVLWEIIYITLAILIFVIIPFAYFFYENDTEPGEGETGFFDTQFGSALAYTLGFFIVFLTILLIMYAFLNKANIPVTKLTEGIEEITLISTNLTLSTKGCHGYCLKSTFNWAIPVTFPVFLMCFVSFLGWFFWTFFVGVGFVALPWDLINDFRTRPVPMDIKEYITQREALGKRAQYLIDAGVALQRENASTHHTQSRAQRNRERTDLLRFEKAYYFLKQDVDLLQACKDLRNTNPIWYFLKLVMGIIGIILSITWVIHIIIFILPPRPYYPFLNNFFITLEQVGGANSGFPLFGVIAFAIYGFYLLWCVVKGNFKLGIRIAFWKIYPMELGKTKMNAFLANTWIILLCSVPTVQFCVRAFPIYARETSIDMLFGTQIEYMKFFKYFWENNVFIIAMLIVVLFAMIATSIQPRNRAAEVEKELQAMAARPAGPDSS